MFFPTFGSAGTTTVLTAQRNPAGALTGGWAASPASLVLLAQNGLTAQAVGVAAGNTTITFAEVAGPSGVYVLRSAPRFVSGITIEGNTNTTSADCLDTTPSGTTDICTNGQDLGLGQRPYSFNMVSSASGTPAVVSASGSFVDGGFPGVSFTISNSPTISPDGTLAPGGQINGSYSRQGNFAPPRSSIPVAVKADWLISAAAQDSLTGTLTIVITPSGNSCGQGQSTTCSGNVTIKRTILTARKR